MDTIFTWGHQPGIENRQAKAFRIKTGQGIFEDSLCNLPAAHVVFDRSLPQLEHATVNLSLWPTCIDEISDGSALFVQIELLAGFLRFLPGDWRRKSSCNTLPGRLHSGNIPLFVLTGRASATHVSCALISLGLHHNTPCLCFQA